MIWGRDYEELRSHQKSMEIESVATGKVIDSNADQNSSQ
jgi:hypothetical protein